MGNSKILKQATSAGDCLLDEDPNPSRGSNAPIVDSLAVLETYTLALAPARLSPDHAEMDEVLEIGSAAAAEPVRRLSGIYHLRNAMSMRLKGGCREDWSAYA